MNRQSVNKLREMLNGQQKLGAQYVTQMYTIFLHSLPLDGILISSSTPLSPCHKRKVYGGCHWYSFPILMLAAVRVKDPNLIGDAGSVIIQK